MKEIWKDIEGANGMYQVSNCGEVRSWNNGRWGKRNNPKKLSQTSTQDGYLKAYLIINGKRKGKLIHRLVAKAFIKNPNLKPQVNHIDGIKINNYPSNLEWVTHQENKAHSFRSGLENNRGSNNPRASLDEKTVLMIKRKIKKNYCYGYLTKLSKETGISRHTLSLIKTEKNWSHVKPELK